MLFPQLVSGWGWNCREVSADRASQRLMLPGKKIWNVSKSEESGRSLWWSVISQLARRCEISFSGWAHFMFCIRKQLLLVRLSISANLMSYPYKWAALVVGKTFFKFPKHVLDLLIKPVACWTFTSRKTSQSMQVIPGMLYSQHVKETWIIFTQTGKSKWFLSKLPWTFLDTEKEKNKEKQEK